MSEAARRPEHPPCIKVHATPRKCTTTQLIMSFRTEMRNLRHTSAKQKRDARFREHDNEKILVFVYTLHNLRFFHPSLKRVARFIGSGDDQKSGNPVQICSAPTERYCVFVSCHYQYSTPMGRSCDGKRLMFFYPPCEGGGF